MYCGAISDYVSDVVIKAEDSEGYAMVLRWALDTIGSQKLEGEDRYRIIQLQQLLEDVEQGVVLDCIRDPT